MGGNNGREKKLKDRKVCGRGGKMIKGREGGMDKNSGRKIGGRNERK